MKNLGEQWIEEIDGKKHMLKAVLQPKQRSHLYGNNIHPCFKCFFQMDDYDCAYPSNDWKCDMEKGTIIKDLGILNEDGLLPCPFCGEYPELFNKGNEYTKKRGSVIKCNKCHYELTVCAIYQTIEWCKEKVLYNWNRRA